MTWRERLVPGTATSSEVLVLGLALMCTSGHLEAQHAPDVTVSDTRYEGCGLCHGPHSGGRSEAYNLRAGASGVIAGAPGLGEVSRSCLRCHSTASERLRQPELAGAGANGKFLHYDLSDDHPLGQLGRNSILDDEAALADPNSVLGRNDALGPFGEGGRIECTLCHDPHEELAIVPGPDRQKVLCGSCHDPATYAFESHVSLACGNCHALHGGHTGDLLAEPTSTILCQSCHETGGVSASFGIGQRASAAVGLPPAPLGHSRPPEGECTGCHRVHE